MDRREAEQIARRKEAEEVIQAIVARRPTIGPDRASQIARVGGDYCSLCGASATMIHSELDHAGDCPWRLAVEYVQRHL